MTASVVWFGHGFGLGLWKTTYPHAPAGTFYSFCILFTSVYIFIPRKTT